MYERKIIQKLYKKLLALYPRIFREQLGESMEQTFQDLWNERQQMQQGVSSFVLWTFIDTAMGIFREHLLLISTGGSMQTTLKTLGSSALISFLLLVPFMVMEVVNRRNFNEDFPLFLFLVMWLNLFAISLIVRGRWAGNRDVANPIPTQGNTLLTKPAWAAFISVIVLLSPGILPLLDSVGWLSLDRLFNGPNPEVSYFPGMLMSLGFILFPVAAGIIAGGPIVRTLRSGGSLFAHPINLVIVVLVLSAFAIGLAGLIIDQWSCFMGVPNCD